MKYSCTVLHYGMSAFGGIGSFENPETKRPQLFRPEQPLNKFYNSVSHLDMPLFEKDELLKCIQLLVNLEKDWYDFKGKHHDNQIYIRMAIFSTDPQIQVKSALKCKIIAFLSPNSISSLEASQTHHDDKTNKTWQQGNASYRISGNFGPLTPAISEAHANGFDDVFWTIDDYAKEITQQNFFLIWKNRKGEMELVTPPDDGTIYNTEKRQTILDMSKELLKE
eukprot:CAMPEP_0202977588 /NCGR_PEP_ID=MMETSP1396-20130829/84336_1 /ASSEMBLY_ACC=CAM_ASM_000872 /TAXON_ID= /ORGANISM="Pseudokeronopsis sp., Strain Brazil" /LENGTH=222 /DNA_ID=CAMNT_0049716357 /DNA_START=267 /DNA_END=935 /DNA_ORIENTATION=+